MRLIDADALIEKLEAWKKEAERRDANINYTFASAIIAQVNAELTIEERKWIPCRERLPEDGENVFVYMFGDSPYIAWINDGLWETDDFACEKEENPVAWMPLPKPWKGEEHEVD